MIYFAGEAKGGDLFYVSAKKNETTFSTPLRVNSQPGSAVAIGNIRGAHLALGRNGRPHVAWMGSNSALPKAPGNETPMLYARFNDAGDAFEPQRNVIISRVNGYHGSTIAGASLGGMKHMHDQGGPWVPGIEHVMQPYAFGEGLGEGWNGGRGDPD